MTLAQIPEFGFFVQNSRIGVKSLFYSNGVLLTLISGVLNAMLTQIKMIPLYTVLFMWAANFVPVPIMKFYNNQSESRIKEGHTFFNKVSAWTKKIVQQYQTESEIG